MTGANLFRTPVFPPTFVRMQALFIKALVVSLALAACGRAGSNIVVPNDTRSAGGPIPWTPTLASPTPSPAPTRTLELCRADQIAASFGDWGVAAGSDGGTFRLSPTGAPCALPTTPAFRFVTADGNHIMARPGPQAGGERVPVIRPVGGSSTFVFLQWSNHGGDPGWMCRARSAPVATLQIQAGAEWIGLAFGNAPPTFCIDPEEEIFVRSVAPEVQVSPRPEPIFEARILAPAEARAGEHMRYLVELTNRTDKVQSFADCPAYVQNIAGPQELGSGDAPGFRYVEHRQTLNCASVSIVAPARTVAFEMYFDIPIGILPGTYVLPWRLDGPIYSIGDKVVFRVHN